MIGTILKAIYEIISWISGRIFFWIDKRSYVEENREYLNQIETIDSEYRPERPDVEVALKCKEYIDQLFPNGVAARISNMSQEELIEFFRRIESEAEQLMGLQIDEVEFYTENDNFCGFYRNEDNSIHINAAFILSGRPELIQEQVYTIFHELKHARQWAAIKGKLTGKADYGYSDDLINSWIENFRHYIPQQVSDELYRKQPVEFDAFGFETILKGERKFEII